MRKKRFRKLKRRGQMQLSFGMIFSIFLIIIFIAFAFYAIKKFIDFQNSVKILQFADDLQQDVDKIWKSSQGSYEAKYSLPLKIESVCFVDKDYENLIFNSNGFVEGIEINHVDIINTLNGEDSLCFENINGKVRMIIKKSFEDALVTISN